MRYTYSIAFKTIPCLHQQELQDLLFLPVVLGFITIFYIAYLISLFLADVIILI